MLQCLGALKEFTRFQIAKPKRYMTPYNNMSCKNNPTPNNKPKVHSLHVGLFTLQR